MSALTNDFGQRIPTPMQVLKHHLDYLSAMLRVEKLTINRQSYKLEVVGGYDPDCYERKPVTFDCVYLYKLGNPGASFSFSFNFEDLPANQHTVRATLKVKQGAGIEYSKEYSTQEMKQMLNAYLGSHDPLKVFTPSKLNVFMSDFAQAFGIILSSDLTPAQVKTLKAEYVSKLQDLKKKLKDNTNEYEKLKKKGKMLNDADRQLMTKLVQECSLYATELNHLLREGGKDIPALSREYALKELKIDTNYLHQGE